MNTYIARLTDRGSLAEPIVWRTVSIAEARELLANVGAWQSSPDDGGMILLSDSAQVEIFDDAPSYRVTDDLDARIVDREPRLYFTIGARGGIRRRVI